MSRALELEKKIPSYSIYSKHKEKALMWCLSKVQHWVRELRWSKQKQCLVKNSRREQL